MNDFINAELVYYSLKRTDSVFSIGPKILPYMDLTFLLSGEMVYYLNNERITLHGGDAILFPPGSLCRRLETDTPVRYASINIRFADGFAPPIAGMLPDCVTSTILFQLELISDIWKTTPRLAGEQCLSLCAYLYYQLVSSARDSQNDYVMSIKRYIADHISDKLTLPELAACVHLTPEYCCTLFKKNTGQTLFDYINHQRIDTAKRLIMLGNRTLSEIAAEVGYPDYNYFSRTFKRMTGHAPSYYRINES